MMIIDNKTKKKAKLFIKQTQKIKVVMIKSMKNDIN